MTDLLGGESHRTTDPDGRDVVFDVTTRRHLAAGGRGWLLQHLQLILGTVAVPDDREDDSRPGRQRYYRQNLLEPGRWLRVVVDFEDEPGRIVTVLVQNNDPRTTQR